MSDIASDPSTSATLGIGGILDSMIDFAGDRDLVRVTLVAGQDYAFDLLGEASGFTLGDPTLSLLDAGGAVAAFDDDGGSNLNAHIDFTATVSGTYYLEAAAFGGIGSYRLQMNSGASVTDDYGASTATAGVLAIGTPLSGAIGYAGDQDWFGVRLLAGVQYMFALQGQQDGHGTLIDPALALSDAAGTVLARNDDGGDDSLDSLLVFTPTTTGTYYLAAAGYGEGTGSYRLTAQASDGTVYGTAGDDVLAGSGGADRFVASGGNDHVAGGGGGDSIVYAGLSHEYARAVSAGSGTISGGPEGGTDTLDSIETIAFADGYLTSDTGSHAAQIARLYHLVLERDPDTLGLNGWVQMLDGGGALTDVANAFAASGEFRAKTGGLNNADFVEYLYTAGLGRPSDPQGKAAWASALDSGGLTRGDLIVGFSESAEYHAIADGSLAHGLFIYDGAYAAVASLYDAFADRLPDLNGLQGWVGALRSGVSIEAVADAFAASPEFQQKIAGLDERGIVAQLYHNVLNRDGDSAGIDGWASKLQADHDLGDLLYGFSASAEHQQLMQPALADGILFM